MRKSVIATSVWFAIFGLSHAADSPASIKKLTNIPAQDLSTALRSVAHDREIYVIFAAQDVQSLRTPGVTGSFTSDETFQRLLAGSGLTYRFINEKTVTILPAREPPAAAPVQEPKADTTSSAQPGKEAQKLSFWDRFRVAQVDRAVDAADRPSGDSDNSDASSRMKVEEVVVTAQKREQRLQDVPISISVLTNQDIERTGAHGMEDYLRSIPGVSQIDSGPASNGIVIRGVATNPEFENFYAAATVGTYFDETPITGATGQFGGGGVDVRPVDLERIEVLRGPQGTSYGDASLGGALRIIPAKPNLSRVEAKVSGSFSQTGGYGSDNTMMQAMLNVPIVSDTLAIRAVAYQYDDSGFYRNIAGVDAASLAAVSDPAFTQYAQGLNGKIEDNVGRILTRGGRAAALWKPSDQLSVALNFLKQDVEQDGLPRAFIGNYLQAELPVRQELRHRGKLGAFADNGIDLTSLVINYDLGWGTLTSATSWVHGDAFNSYDAVFDWGFPLSNTSTSDLRTWKEEARLATHLDGPFQFLGGVFYEDVKEQGTQTLDWAGAPAANPISSVNPIIFADFGRKLEQKALFGEVSYAITPQLTATAGGRYFDYSKSERQLLEGAVFSSPSNPNGTPLGGGTPQTFGTDKSGSIFKANLNYKLNDDSSLYTSWSQGYRLGRATAGLPPDCDADSDGIVDGLTLPIAATRKIDPDSLNNYEIGSKLSFLDRRLSVNASVFRIDWKDLPVSAVSGCRGLTYTANVGEARSEGVELQTTAIVADGLRVDVGGSYTKARLTTDAPDLGATAGDRLPGSPKYLLSAATQYDFTFAGHEMFFRIDSLYVGKFYRDLLQSQNLDAGDYVKIDARVGVTLDSVSVELFGSNLTNEDAFTWRRYDSGPTRPFAGYQMRPRTVGIQLNYSFK